MENCTLQVDIAYINFQTNEFFSPRYSLILFLFRIWNINLSKIYNIIFFSQKLNKKECSTFNFSFNKIAAKLFKGFLIKVNLIFTLKKLKNYLIIINNNNYKYVIIVKNIKNVNN